MWRARHEVFFVQKTFAGYDEYLVIWAIYFTNISPRSPIQQDLSQYMCYWSNFLPHSNAIIDVLVSLVVKVSNDKLFQVRGGARKLIAGN